jgi:EpsG family
MITTTILGLLAVLLAYLGRYKNMRWGFKASFVLIFAFLALRYDFGNDYRIYLQTFQEISGTAGPEDFGNPLQFEIGWLYMNWWFRHIGFFAMIALLALLNCIVYYRFIRKYVPPNLYWLGVFLYVFTPQLMLINASTMRQSVATMLFVHSIDYIQERKPIHYIVCVGLATLFHLTAIVLLPLYLLGSPKWTLRMATRIGSVVTFIALILFGEVFSLYIQKFVGIYLPKYELYQDVGTANTGLGVIFLFTMLILFLYIESSQRGESAVVMRLGAVWCMLGASAFVLSLLARITMYLIPATLAACPVVFKNLRWPMEKAVFLVVLCAFTIYLYVEFFSSDVWADWYGTYWTIFSAPYWE